MPETAVVLLNWNGLSLLKRFLPNVVEKSKGQAQIWIADNASSDDSLQWVKEHFPEIGIVLNTGNLGFAEGYNKALKQIHAEYYILLNTDIEVTDHWIEPLIELMEKDKAIACCQPKIRSLEKREHFEHAGAAGGFIDRLAYPFCRGRILQCNEKDVGQYDQETEIFWATGACLCIRSSLFLETGGFDERFLAHMEEIDLCWRLKNRGYKVMFCPKSMVYHLGGGTLPYLSPEKTFLNFRNNLLMLCKNLYGSSFIPLLLCRFLLDGVAGLKFLAGGQIAHFSGVLRAHFSFYCMLPAYIKLRKKLKSLQYQPNLKGIYRKSIVIDYYLRGKKQFKRLNKNDFY